MDAITEMLSRGLGQLLDRASGPFHCRLVIMPLVVTFLAARAGLKDARDGQPAFLWAVLTNSGDRRRLFASVMKDIGRVLVMAVVLDTTYQLLVLRTFYPVQLMIVVIVCAVVPYVLIRGPVTRLTRRLYRNQAEAAKGSAARTTPTTQVKKEN